MQEAIEKEHLPVVIFVVPDGQEAIDFIARAERDPAAPCPEFILLDLNLPKKDGFEVLRRLRESEKCSGVPVLIVTSSDSAADQEQAAKMGAAYFRKPPSYAGFLRLGEVLKQLMTERQMV